MTVTRFGFLPKTIFRLLIRGFLIYNLQCFEILYYYISYPRTLKIIYVYEISYLETF